jgi:hypothetical protein
VAACKTANGQPFAKLIGSCRPRIALQYFIDEDGTLRAAGRPVNEIEIMFSFSIAMYITTLAGLTIGNCNSAVLYKI